ncbi:unnamed protein product [Allacma fusca]|uniref:Uncharacterized protein n=1 Tax=Allacma fusca TaxID=39272 RepID=A0A8J2LAH5_9HEXA|nr:unnamed protein product [Allacma fusca]
MANLFWKALLIPVLLQCSFPSFANVDTLNSEGVTESGKDRHWQENGDSDDISLQQLQENYNNNTLELMEFIKSLTTTLSKRLDILEKNSLSKSTTSKPLNESISSGDIAAGVPDDYSLTVEIVNYLDVELTDYQLFLGFGLIHQGDPTVVAAKTREVVTFKRVPYGAAPHGVLLYRVGDTGVSLHLVFYHAIFAVGFLENKALISTIWPIWEGCNKYTHSGTPDSMKCIGDIEIRQNQIRNLTIHHGPIYTKLTIQTKKIHHRWILTMEVFKLDT